MAAAAVTMAFSSESLWFQEEQGIVGDAVQSEETDFLLQVVSLPDREEVEVLDGHPEDTEELLLREVSLPGRETCRQRERERGGERGGNRRFIRQRETATVLPPAWFCPHRGAVCSALCGSPPASHRGKSDDINQSIDQCMELLIGELSL